MQVGIVATAAGALITEGLGRMVFAGQFWRTHRSPMPNSNEVIHKQRVNWACKKTLRVPFVNTSKQPGMGLASACTSAHCRQPRVVDLGVAKHDHLIKFFRKGLLNR